VTPSSIPDRLPAGARVVVAMSGGVDSSVTAALLAEAGYDVVGITLQLYDHGAATGRKGACCAGRDIEDARAVADRLGIPHYVLDFEARFKAAVIDDFAAAYAEGRTPIPCVRCNERVKFRDLLLVARDLGAEALATGHYVRRTEGPAGPELHRAADPAKDQSYFLFATTREQLGFLRFPLGALDKAATREEARRFGLPVAQKPDSQDICFVPTGHYSGVVARLRPEALAPGEIVHVDGRVLGRHEGTAHFTVGQRRGLGVADGERLYVVGIEPAAHRVVVGPKEASRCGRVELSGVNWLAGPPPAGGGPVEVKTRYNEPATAARVHDLGQGRARVDLLEPQPGIAPGQACVFYDGTRLLGGGWIERAPLLWQEPAAS
jgi:tRNA-specific 2-thiouridylase